MEPTQSLNALRPAWVALLITVMLFMVGAWAAAYFRQWPLPATSQEKLTLIANDRIGWTAQAIIFPVCFLAVAIIFGWIAVRLPDGLPRGLAVAATVAGMAALLLWLPITMNRLYLGAQAAALLAGHDPNAPLPVLVNADTFWPYTAVALAGIALMGAALALAGTLPVLGWVVAGLCVAGALAAAFVLHDWPPFMSYLILLILAGGLMRGG